MLTEHLPDYGGITSAWRDATTIESRVRIMRVNAIVRLVVVETPLDAAFRRRRSSRWMGHGLARLAHAAALC